MAALSFRTKLLVAAALTLASLVLVTDASAVQKGKKKNPNLNPNAPLVTELVAARHLLHEALHDYKGHRAKAVHEINKAIHALEPKHKHPKVGQKPNPNNEPQSVSDMQLQKALTHLQNLQPNLVNVTFGNPTLANAHLTNAISELKTALSIK